jgi:hypothetical protein
MSAINEMVLESQEQHRRYFELYGKVPTSGDGLRDAANDARMASQQTKELRDDVVRLNFSTCLIFWPGSVGLPYLSTDGGLFLCGETG